MLSSEFMHLKSLLVGFVTSLLLTGLISGSYYLGINQSNKQSQIVVQQIPSPTVTLTPTPSEKPSPTLMPKAQKLTSTPTMTPISSPSQLLNLSMLCQSDADAFKAKAKISYNDMIMEITRQPDGDNFLQSQGAYAKSQYFAQIDNSAALMISWCLEHNRDYSGMPIPKY